METSADGIGSGLGATVRLKAGAGTEPALPQTLFRLGGLGTVRGFEYGTLRAPAFWAAQLDMTPFGGRVRPVIFLDAGQASQYFDVCSPVRLWWAVASGSRCSAASSDSI